MSHETASKKRDLVVIRHQRSSLVVIFRPGRVGMLSRRFPVFRFARLMLRSGPKGRVSKQRRAPRSGTGFVYRFTCPRTRERNRVNIAYNRNIVNIRMKAPS